MAKKSKAIWILIGIVCVMAIVIVSLIFGLKLQSPIVFPSQNHTVNTVCTQDAKQCPDGSYVGRVAPDCNFAPCPNGNVPVVNQTVGAGACVMSMNNDSCTDDQGTHPNVCQTYNSIWTFSCAGPDGSEYCAGKEISCLDKVCIKAKCISQEDMNCIDTDGGKDLGYFGFCVDRASSNQDSCAGNFAIREYDCVNDLCQATVLNCPTGQTCKAGACA